MRPLISAPCRRRRRRWSCCPCRSRRFLARAELLQGGAVELLPRSSMKTVAAREDRDVLQHLLAAIAEAGALTAATLIVPRSLLTTSVARASPSTSSAMMSSSRPAARPARAAGAELADREIFFSWMRMNGSSSSRASSRCRSRSRARGSRGRTACPRRSRARLDRLVLSTVMTPSLPTFSIASARMTPISSSPLALMVATWAIWALSLAGFAALQGAEDRLDAGVDAALERHRVVPASTSAGPRS
jgi:hypothetical protein